MVNYLGFGSSRGLELSEFRLQLLVLSLQHQLAALQLLGGRLLRAQLHRQLVDLVL